MGDLFLFLPWVHVADAEGIEGCREEEELNGGGEEGEVIFAPSLHIWLLNFIE